MTAMTTHDHHPIVVAIPTDDDLDTALSYAAAEARLHGCGLRLVHAHHAGDEGHAELVLARAAAMARLLAGPSVRVTTRRVAGAPVEAVLSASPDALLVVLRSRDSLHLLQFMNRGTARSVTRPAVVCLPRTWSPRHDDPRPVLLAISDPTTADSELSQGLQFARAHRTSLHVLHTWHLPDASDGLVQRQVGPELTASFRAPLEACLGRVRRQGDFADVAVDLEVRHGVAADAVLQAAGEAQVLLLGRNAPTPGGAVHLGRTARTAVHMSPCPTVLLASPSPTAQPRVEPSIAMARKKPQVSVLTCGLSSCAPVGIRAQAPH
jgi:nucleotide-binding universal stress UspA family protein